MVTVQDLANYINQGAIEDGMADDLAVATELVLEYVSAHVPTAVHVPDAVHDRAVVLAAENLWGRRQAPTGQLNEAWGNGEVAAPIRVSRDALAPVYPLLAQWTTPLGFA